jgi:hypothetical protein
MAKFLFSAGNDLYANEAIFEASTSKSEYGFRRSMRGFVFLRLPLGGLATKQTASCNLAPRSSPW